MTTSTVPPEIDQLNAEHLEAIRVYEANEDELAAAVAKRDQLAAERREIISAPTLDPDRFRGVDTKVKAADQDVAMLEARRDALRAQGEDVERRRMATVERWQREQREKAIAQLEADARSANRALIAAMQRIYQSMPSEVREAVGSWSWIFGGSEFAAYACKQHEFRLRATALDVAPPQAYGPGIVQLLVARGQLQEPTDNRDPLSVA